MLWLSSLLYFLVILTVGYVDFEQREVLNEDLVNRINLFDFGWTAGHNSYFHGKTMADVKALCGVKPPGGQLPKPKLRKPHQWGMGASESSIADLPKDFDIRKEWGRRCPVVYEVRDQARCGGCWAMCVVSAASERACIQTRGKKHVQLSAQDVLSCCRTCGDGCLGGWPQLAWDYLYQHGVVSGASYGSNEGCYPYDLPHCYHHVGVVRFPDCGDVPSITPSCRGYCQNHENFANDRMHFNHSKEYNSEEDIMRALAEDGPLATFMKVYEDFPLYKTGIYKRTPNTDFLGYHALLLHGYGEEKGVKYWIAKNSWNEDWGDKGYIKILRGTNECSVEQGSTAANILNRPDFSKSGKQYF